MEPKINPNNIENGESPFVSFKAPCSPMAKIFKVLKNRIDAIIFFDISINVMPSQSPEESYLYKIRCGNLLLYPIDEASRIALVPDKAIAHTKGYV